MGYKSLFALMRGGEEDKGLWGRNSFFGYNYLEVDMKRETSTFSSSTANVFRKKKSNKKALSPVMGISLKVTSCLVANTCQFF